jgi:hypothetical protein
MKDGQGAADCASFQDLDKPIAWASKPWNPASRLTPESDREYRREHERGHNK